MLKVLPPSFAQIQAFKQTCTTRKRIRKIPVKDMIIFLPTEEENS
jgi:hypothetical protein